MTPHYADDSVQLYAGDCLDVLRELPDASVDAVVTDPPAGIGFMGRDWDHHKGGREQWIAWLAEVMGEALRVIKPGGHALVWAMPRTSHWTATALEDAGWEIRDCITHLFGSGFPKSLDVSKAIDRAAPRVGMFDAFAEHFRDRRVASGYSQKDVAKHFPSKTGGLTGCAWNWENGANVPTPDQWTILAPMLGLSGEWQPLIERIEAERAVVGNGKSGAASVAFIRDSAGEFDVTAPATDAARLWQGFGTALKPASEHWWLARRPLSGTVAATVLEYGTGALNIDASRVGSDERVNQPARTLGNGVNMSGGAAQSNREATVAAGRWPPNVVLDGAAADELDTQSGTLTSGKMRAGIVPKGERNTYGKDAASGYETSETYGDSGGASRFFPVFKYAPKAGSIERPRSEDIAHPTVKPLDLMRWLVKLVTPPGGTILEPFAGSGTTCEAAVIEGFKCIAIERDETYLPLIVARLSKPIQVALDFDGEAS